MEKSKSEINTIVAPGKPINRSLYTDQPEHKGLSVGEGCGYITQQVTGQFVKASPSGPIQLKDYCSTSSC